MVSRLRVNELESLADGSQTTVSFLAGLSGIPDAVDQKVDFAGSVTEVKTLDLAAGDAVYLTEEGREGLFVTKTGTAPIDAEEGIYISLNNGSYIERLVSGIVSVKWFGAAGDGTADDTSAFQAAFDFAKASGHQVFVPSTSQYYRLTSTLTVDFGLRIIGEGVSPYGSGGPFQNRGTGSWLKFEHIGVGISVSGTGFISGFVAQGVGTFRDHTNDPIVSPWTPDDHDFDFKFNNTDFILQEVMLLNATRGIRLENADAGRCTINNVRGQCFKVMLELEDVYDTTRVDGMHMWPFWANEAAVNDYTKDQATFIRVWRCDNPSFTNLFSIFTNIALEVKSNANGSLNKLKASNWDMDITNYGVLVDSTVSGATGFFQNVTSWGTDTANTNNYNHRILGSDCTFIFSGVEGSNLSRGIIRVEGTGNEVTLGGCIVGTTDRLVIGAPIFDVTAGNTINISDIVYHPSGSKVYDGGGEFYYPQYVMRGDSQVNSGTTSVTINHGLPKTPGQSQIILSRSGPAQGGGELYVLAGSANDTTFEVICESAPTADVWFSWRAALEH